MSKITAMIITEYNEILSNAYLFYPFHPKVEDPPAVWRVEDPPAVWRNVLGNIISFPHHFYPFHPKVEDPPVVWRAVLGNNCDMICP
jgi:hypothetical protein